MKFKRLFGALLLALPISWLVTAIGDNSNTPAFVRALVSPGMTIALQLDTSGESVLGAVVKMGLTALFLNEFYWVLITYCGQTCIASYHRPHASKN